MTAKKKKQEIEKICDNKTKQQQENKNDDEEETCLIQLNDGNDKNEDRYWQIRQETTKRLCATAAATKKSEKTMTRRQN